MLTCPGGIIRETDKPNMQVFWKEPTYTDNCGVYPDCKIDKSSTIDSGTLFVVDIPYTVKYTARDPSSNVNVECSFQVRIKKKPGTETVFGLVIDDFLRIIIIYWAMKKKIRPFYMNFPD